MNSKGDEAHASWMAADLLGDHWSTTESVPLLLAVAKSARPSVVRADAVGGLAKAHPRSSVKDRMRISHMLEQIAKMDRSRAVRAAASEHLREINAPLHTGGLVK